jgi:hypothetical protein
MGTFWGLSQVGMPRDLLVPELQAEPAATVGFGFTITGASARTGPR